MPGPQRQLLNQDMVCRKGKKKSGFADEEAKMVRKIRVICDDPDATDSSSEDEDRNDKAVGYKRLVREIKIPVTPSPSVFETDCSSQDSNVKPKAKKSFSRPKGIRQRRWGKWSATIQDPFLGGRLWLGTYNSAEEASKAYERAFADIFGGKSPTRKTPKSFDYPKFISKRGCTEDSINSRETNGVESSLKSNLSSAGSLSVPCVSEDSEPLSSLPSPSSVLEVSTSTSLSTKCEDNVTNGPTSGFLEEPLIPSSIGKDFQLEFDSFFTEKFSGLEEDFLGLEDIPLCGLSPAEEKDLSELDFDLDADAIAWMNL